MAKPTIAVLGGTGRQGGGVVASLLAAGQHTVRVATRNPASEGAKALAQRGVEVVKADLLDGASLKRFFEGAHGAFVVTNFWDPQQMQKETAIGVEAVKAARASGAQHLIWSSLPDCEKLSGGRLHVMHFTGKARVDEAVRSAGFARHTFVYAPFYYQNFLTMMAAQPLPGGGRGWAVPMDPAARGMAAGDATEFGRAVAAAFVAGDKLANGTTLGVCAATYSWNDWVSTLNAQGHQLQVVRVPAEVFDKFFPGAEEIRQMYEFFEEFTYFGPDAKKHIAATQALVPGGFTSFADWAKSNMRPS